MRLRFAVCAGALAGCVFNPPDAGFIGEGDVGSAEDGSLIPIDAGTQGGGPKRNPTIDVDAGPGADTDSLNAAPIATDDQARTEIGRPVTVDVLLNDSDPDGDTLRVTTVSAPQNGVARLVGRSVHYEPAPSFEGTDSFAYTVTDEIDEATALIRVTVEAGALAVLPRMVQMNLNSRQTFTVRGGAPPYELRLGAGSGDLDPSTGEFFSPGSPGVSRIEAEDATGAVATASVTYGDGDLFYLGGHDDTTDTSRILRSSNGSTWSDVGSLGQPRYLHTAVVYEDAVWVVGGRDAAANVFQDVLRSTDGTSFSPVGAAPLPLRGSKLVVFDRALVLIGGADQLDGIGGEVWTSTNGADWNQIGALVEGRAFGSAAVYAGRIWYAGGVDVLGLSRSTVMSSDDGVVWRTDASMPSPRRHAAMLAHSERLRILGGSSDLADGRDDHWVTIDGTQWDSSAPALPAALGGHAVISWMRRLYVVGGATSFTPAATEQVHVFDPMIPGWRVAGQLPAPRFFGTLIIFSPP